VYRKLNATDPPGGRHLLLKARKLRLPLGAAIADGLARFGTVENLSLASSGAFLYCTFAEAADAASARDALSADRAFSALLGCGDRRGATVHFCAARDLHAEAAEAARPVPHPPGLHLLEEFLSAEAEAEIVGRVERDVEWSTNAGHRRVAHFGHTFSYATRAVDFGAATTALPEWTAPLLERLRHAVAPLGLGEWVEPDQLTVNEYEPGQGIAAHVETHSAFGDVLCGISLQSGVTMDFKNCERRAALADGAAVAPGAADEQGWGIRMISGVAAPRFRPFSPIFRRLWRVLSVLAPGSRAARKNGEKTAEKGPKTGWKQAYLTHTYVCPSPAG